jgi:hypothetical protein
MQKADDTLSPLQRERLTGFLKAINANEITLRKRKTRLFPFNLSTAIFVYLINDPILDLPRVLGYLAVNEAGAQVDAAAWTLSEKEDRVSVWQDFSDRLLKTWTKSIGKEKGPHLFHFGERIRHGLQEWAELAGDADRLSFLWQTGCLHHTDLLRLMQEHFYFPAPGSLTLFSLGRMLGVTPPAGADVHALPPESFFHGDPEPAAPYEAWKWDERSLQDVIRHVEWLLMLQNRIWSWARAHLESDMEQTEWEDRVRGQDLPAAPYLDFLEEQKRLKGEDILALQEHPLAERMERFRALGPLTFQGTSLDEEGRFLYTFQVPSGGALSKFREDDFLRLAPSGARDLQSGFPVILSRYRQGDDRLCVLSRQGRFLLSKRLTYSLEEDVTDWNHPKLVHVVRTALSEKQEPRMERLLSGDCSMTRERARLSWIRNHLQKFAPMAGLNASQQAALELPFRKRLALIEGPPGTGKTHLLGWIIIALMLEAQQSGEPLRIAVSALTHRAIDGVLRKVADLVADHRIENFSAHILKWGRWKEEGPAAVQPLNDPEEIRQSRYLVLGSTGFGLYNLFKGETGTFAPVFDWIVFDEASQILVPQALLSLVYGEGRYLFLGDVKQLPPVILGRGNGSEGENQAGHSILAHLLSRYGAEHRVRLDQTYRMNEELCAFPSRMWYDGALHAAPGNAHSRLELIPVSSDELPDRILDPEKPVVLVLANHRGCHQKSDLEAEIVAQLACRLMAKHGLSPDRLAIISPHRAQNNVIAIRLRYLLEGSVAPLPVIDTVERLQGAEHDVILFCVTTSDPDHVTSEFLNNPNRFNVAFTRARKKLVVVGSRAFFLTVPGNEEALQANRCFKEFMQFCRKRSALFIWGRA